VKDRVRFRTEYQKGVLALILLALVFSSMGLFARYLATGFLLFFKVYLRMLAAFVVGYVVLRKQISIGKFRKLPLREWLIILFRAVSYSLFRIILFTQAIIIFLSIVMFPLSGLCLRQRYWGLSSFGKNLVLGSWS